MDAELAKMLEALKSARESGRATESAFVAEIIARAVLAQGERIADAIDDLRRVVTTR